jgi:hypothetical protein
MSESTREDIERRLHILNDEFVAEDVVEEMYGLELPGSSLAARFEAWAERHYERDAPVFDDNGNVHRWRLETFLQQQSLLPVEWAAARLGMTDSSFLELAETLIDEHLLDWDIDKQVVRENDVDGIRDHFDELKWQTFEGIQSFCSTLHSAIEKEFGLEVEPLHCSTSDFLDEEPVLFARRFDVLTDEPMSATYEHWLETDKPMHLRPDACSTLTLVRHEELLEDRLLPGEETQQTGTVKARISNTGRRP